jgi:hypothetical protein
MEKSLVNGSEMARNCEEGDDRVRTDNSAPSDIVYAAVDGPSVSVKTPGKPHMSLSAHCSA